MSKYSIEIETTVTADLDDFEEDDIIGYLENQGYTVIHSAANASESASALDEIVSVTDRYANAHMAIKNIIEVCHRYNYSNIFYKVLLTSLLNLHSWSDKETITERLKEIL